MAQQLLDALLLPPIALQPEAERVEHSLNTLQANAANHREGLIYLKRGMAQGKPSTRPVGVEGLLSDGIDPRRILLLT